jgi:sulfide:quinone oxidoreductase
MTPARIVILGAGFAALTAVRELRRRAPTPASRLIAPKAEFVYLPSLIWVPTGIRQGKDLILPLDRFIKDHAVEFIAGRVTGLEDGGRTVVTDQGKVANDALVIATGGRFIKKLPGIEHALTLCEGVASAEAIRDRLEKMTSGRIAMGFGGNPNEPSAMRGGPMFELLFGIDTWLRRQGRRDRVELTFFNAAAEPGKRLGEKAVSGLLAEMARRRIDTHLGHKPLGFSEKGVDTEGGHVNADLILFMPGLTGPAWAADSGLTLSPGGFFKADDYCRVDERRPDLRRRRRRQFPRPRLDAQAGAHGRPSGKGRRGEPAAGPRRCGPRGQTQDRADLHCRYGGFRHPGVSDTKRSWVLPSSRIFHWAKRYFEGHYLRDLRP